MNERTRCTCHDLSVDQFRSACADGAHNVKTCFKTLGCLPQCNKCIPLVRSVLNEFSGQAPQNTVAHVPSHTA